MLRIDVKELGFVLRHLRAEVVGADLDRAQLCLRLRHPRTVEQLRGNRVSVNRIRSGAGRGEEGKEARLGRAWKR